MIVVKVQKEQRGPRFQLGQAPLRTRGGRLDDTFWGSQMFMDKWSQTLPNASQHLTLLSTAQTSPKPVTATVQLPCSLLQEPPR